MSATTKKMGFWQCWGMSVGVMIGSGIFLLPAVLAPYGWIRLVVDLCWNNCIGPRVGEIGGHYR